MSGSDPAAASFVFSARNYLKATHKTQVMERGGEVEAPQDSRTKFCSYCGRGFEPSKALCDLETKNCNKSNRSSPRQGRGSTKNATAVGRVHQCQICGKTFATGQALGGHKTYHRKKDPLKVKLESVSPECCLPGSLPEQAQLSEEAHPKKVLDFDLNIPYQE